MCRLATEKNAKQSQTYNPPGDEFTGAVPWFQRDRKQEVDVKNKKKGKGCSTATF